MSASKSNPDKDQKATRGRPVGRSRSTVAFSLPEELIELLKRASAATGESQSRIAEEGISRFLRALEEARGPFPPAGESPNRFEDVE